VNLRRRAGQNREKD